MKNKKLMKIISFVVILLTIAMMGTSVFAAATKGAATGDISMDPENYKTGTSSNLSSSTNNIMSQILGVIQIVAMFIAVIMLIILAVKYFSAAPQEKADIKKSLTIYVIGAVLLFGASGILGIIKNFANGIE